MNRDAIILAYAECEAAARRANPPHGLLCMDDVKLCAQQAAEECGVSYEEGREVLTDAWGKIGGG